MTNKEAKVRIFIAAITLLYAIDKSSISISIISILLYYTAIKKFSFIYYFFNINKKMNIENYYPSLLPRNRSTPVFIFNKKGKILFENNPSKIEFPHVKSTIDIQITNFKNIIENNKIETTIFKHKDKYYKIEIKGLSSEQLLLTYFTDITEIMTLNAEIEDTQKEVIYAMAEIGEKRSKETGNHVKRVALYSKELALLYGLSKKEAELLQIASPMHDIGKVGIPDSILNAPRKLNNEEWKIMKTHTQLGYEMLNKSKQPILKAAAIVAYEHHEKWDGSGYPNGISAENIHIYGRITAIADVFDALGSERKYKKSWKLEDILSFLQKESGKQFDPKLIQLFMDNLDIFLEIQNKYSEKI